MHHALIVGVLQGLANLGHDGQRLLRLQLALAEQLPQVGPVHVFHEEVVQRPTFLGGRALACRQLGAAEVVHGDDVRMAKPGQRAGLAAETRLEGRVLRQLRWENLQGHQAVEVRLAGLVHCTHATGANEFKNFQLGKGRGQFGRCWRHKAAGSRPVGCRHGFFGGRRLGLAR